MDSEIVTRQSSAAIRSREPSPAEAFRAVREHPGVAFLDGRAGLARAPWSILAWSPRNRLNIDAGAHGLATSCESGDDPLARIDAFLDCESAAGRSVIGAIAYEVGRFIEPRAGSRGLVGAPLVRLASYDEVHAYDHRSGRWSAVPSLPPYCRDGSLHVGALEPTMSWEAYRSAFGRARQWIEAGDVYQVNLSMGFEGVFGGDPTVLYERLASRHPAPYGAYLDAGDFQLLSISPELFLARRGDRIATRPIKGTRPRGRQPAEDARLRKELLHDRKERAEHVMIVDLERNDLGRIAEIGSVQAHDLWTVATYPGLHHLESTVSARLRPGLRFSDLLRATFPSGSITGAPKLRAMQIIDALEDAPRGFYTGGILHHAPQGDFTMSVAIRTATVRSDRIRYRAGGGLVWDSTPSDEFAECLLKARAFIEATGVS